ncbi:MAG TPA: maltotransferase domain-containing protein, partial [Arthrobacter sp.]|nr:maltotransferase domain-containing protein [Arthrobacter sp.]
MEGLRFGRFPITAVQPAVEGGKFPAKAVVGETLVVGATSFREGHDRLGVSAVLLDPRGKERQRVRLAPPRGPRGMGTDRWEGLLTPSGTGNWSFVIEAWHDSYGTWHHNAEVKVEAGIDVELMLDEGAALLSQAAEESFRNSADRNTLRAAVVGLSDTSKSAEERLAAGFGADVAEIVGREPIRE